MTWSLILRSFAAVLIAAPICTAAGAQETLKIAIGQRGGWEQSVCELGQSKGFFKQHGLVLDVLYTQGSAETLQSVISNSVDVGIGLGTHAVLGALLCGQWKIPATLVDTIELHHHPAVTSLDSVSPRIRELTAVVFVANQMAKYSGCHGDDMEIDLPTGALLASLGLPGTLDQVHEEMLPQVQRPMQAFLGGTGVQQEEAITT